MSELLTELSKTGPKKEETFFLLYELSRPSSLTRRELSSKLNISLGKTNYLLKELVKKGIIKIKNYSLKNEKIKKAKYILTPKGFKEKASLTYNFLKIKETEYNRIKEMWEEVKNKAML